MTREEITELMKESLGKILKVDPQEIDEDESFFKLGVSSVQALKVVNIMRKELDVDVNPVAMFEFKTISEISNYLYEISQK